MNKIVVIGLGYVGLPLARLFATKYPVVGFDINKKRVSELMSGIDSTLEIDEVILKEIISSCHCGVNPQFHQKKGLFCSNNLDDIRNSNIYIITVPTPIDEYNQPDLTPLINASAFVGKVLNKGDYIIYESTVYPGCTEEDCIPILEKESGLTLGKDFKVGYSPERINPGDKVNTLSNTKKIVSGCDDEALNKISQLYESIIAAGIHRATNIKVAEAAKIIENTQRDINIALMNELSIIFSRIGLNTYDVIEAAGTKWNFLKYYPGLVGGHCIGVDPYYLLHKAKQKGYHAQLIGAGRFINDSMGTYIAKQTVKKLLAANKHLLQSRVLILGFTFKENVADIRNSKVAYIVKELQSYRVKTNVIDPYVDMENVMHEYQIEVIKEPAGKYDAIIVTVAHKEYREYGEEYFLNFSTKNAILIDVKGLYKNQIKQLSYWSL
ncbi:MAG: nucleotide sugar dehydrogenase [Tannerellaceae bacterium]|jgi:UDP-N-acetyl-D-galactosamine dehydrogenase|nr:nucleotide sugar dehydrogenase [Tannerellaceae bacterium]